MDPSMSSTAAATLSHPILSLAKQILRLRCKHKKGSAGTSSSSAFLDDEDNTTADNQRNSAESLLGQAFAGVSSLKAAYARLQFAESPYEPEAIQSSDRAIVAHLKQLSHLKHCFLGDNSFFHEQRNVTLRNMESTLDEKNRELSSLRNKLLESEERNIILESKLRPESSIATLHNLHLSALDPTHFLRALRHATLALRHFVRHHLVGNITVEGQVGNHMFSGFNRHHFGLDEEAASYQRRQFFDEFRELRGRSLKELLDGKRDGEVLLFQRFCRTKFGSLPVMAKGELLFLRFAEVARRVWLLHLLFFSFEPEAEASIFVVGRGCRYSEVYMEGIWEGEVPSVKERCRKVAFTVVPGFKLRKTVIQSKVCLQRPDGRS